MSTLSLIAFALAVIQLACEAIVLSCAVFLVFISLITEDKLLLSIDILLPCIVVEPSLFILFITEFIFNLLPSIFALGLILSFVIEPSVIPSLVTPLSSNRTVVPSLPLTLIPYTEPSAFTSPKETLSFCLFPTPSNTCNLFPVIRKF